MEDQSAPIPEELGRMGKECHGPSCSQNAHDRNVLAWDKSASMDEEAVLADSGRAGEIIAGVGRVRMLRAVKDRLGHSLNRGLAN
jgi:hypothetical protein